MEKKITSTELFSYGFSHAYTAGLISFVICLIIQSLLNYFFFNLKKKLNKIKNEGSENKNRRIKEEIFQVLKSAKKCFIIIFGISLVIMLIVFYSAIAFNGAYRGGAMDLIAGALWTFIFLQIIPFLYCLIFAFCRYQGIKKNKEKLYNFGLSVFF